MTGNFVSLQNIFFKKCSWDPETQNDYLYICVAIVTAWGDVLCIMPLLMDFIQIFKFIITIVTELILIPISWSLFKLLPYHSQSSGNHQWQMLGNICHNFCLSSAIMSTTIGLSTCCFTPPPPLPPSLLVLVVVTSFHKKAMSMPFGHRISSRLWNQLPTSKSNGYGQTAKLTPLHLTEWQ